MHTDPHRPSRLRRHLAALLAVVGVAAAAPGVASLAGFTARDVNRDNVIAAGALDIAFGQGRRYVSIANMKPGDWLDQTVTVVNGGSLASDYLLRTDNLRVTRGADLDEVLRVSISRNGQVLAEGLRLSEVRIPAGRLAPGAVDTLEFRVVWTPNPAEIDNRYQGAALEFDLVVEASQVGSSTAAPPTTPATGATGVAINGVPGLTSIDVPFDPASPAITVVNANSTRFTVTNLSTDPITFRFNSTGTTEVWDGSGEWIETIVSAEWGWDGFAVELAPGESRQFIANSWDAPTTLSVVPLP
jgi:hypothetical protein